MRRILLLLTIFLGICTSEILAQGFDVNAYNVEVTIDKDGFFDVIETYDVYFNVQKHGIFRDIQLRYDLITETGKKEIRRIEVSNIEVPNHQFTTTSKFEQRLDNNLHIRIGDPNKKIAGYVQYEIRYRVKNALLFEEDNTRFYWNLKPTLWQPAFKNVKFVVNLPPNAAVDPADVFLYAGYAGYTDPTTEFDMEVTDGRIVAKSKPKFASRYGEAVTLLINMPVGSVIEQKPAWPYWTEYGWSLILAALVALYSLVFFRHGKDDPAPAATSYYPPKDLDPAMAGFLINDRSDTRDLISFIPFWAAQGLIRIEEIDKKGLFAKDDTKLTKLMPLPAGRPAYERKIFNGLFSSEDEVLISSLRNKFFSKMNSAKRMLKKDAQKYYVGKSKKILVWMAFIIVLSTFITVPVFFYFWSFLAVGCAILFSIVMLIVNSYMIKKNKQGTRILSELKGFKQFIKTAEEGKLKMLIQESPAYFESTLAYAMSFGSFKKWAKKFEDLNIPPPDWYSHTSGNRSFNNFSNSFNSSMRSASSVMVSSPSSSGSGGSSGGGSSGGGFGGGGGGSW